MAEEEAAKPAPPAPEAKPEGKGKAPGKSPSIPRKCPHCGEMKALGHIPGCAKNPKKGQPKQPKAAAPKRKAAKPAAPKPASKQDTFLDGRKKELQVDPAAAPPPPPPPADKPKKQGGGMISIAIAALGGLFLLWILFRKEKPDGDMPAERGDEAPPPEVQANGYIPGVGPVHVPNLQA